MIKSLIYWMTSRRLFQAIKSLVKTHVEHTINASVAQNLGAPVPQVQQDQNDQFVLLTTDLPPHRQADGNRLLGNLLTTAIQESYNEIANRGRIIVNKLREAWNKLEQSRDDVEDFQFQPITTSDLVDPLENRSKAGTALAQHKASKKKYQAYIIGSIFLLMVEFAFNAASLYLAFEDYLACLTGSFIVTLITAILAHSASRFWKGNLTPRNTFNLFFGILAFIALVIALLRLMPYVKELNVLFWFATTAIITFSIIASGFLVSWMWKKALVNGQSASQKWVEYLGLSESVKAYDRDANRQWSENERMKNSQEKQLADLQNNLNSLDEVVIPQLHNQVRKAVVSDVDNVLEKVSPLIWQVARLFARWQIDEGKINPATRGEENDQDQQEQTLVALGHDDGPRHRHAGM